MDRTVLLVDYWWTFVLPFICLCSIATSALSLVILHTLRRINQLYRLLYVKTLVNLFYLSICFWIFLVKCGHLCPSSSSLASFPLISSWITFSIQVYKFYLYGFVGNVLAYSDLLIEVILSIERFRLINNSPTSHKMLTHAERTTDGKRARWHISFSFKITLVFAVSVLVYLPSLFFAKLTSVQPMSAFPYRLQMVNVKLYESTKMFTAVFLRSIPTLILVVFINMINYLYINRKVEGVSTFQTTNPRTLSARLVRNVIEANSKFKRMLFYQSLLFMFGNSFMLVAFAIIITQPDCSQHVSCALIPLVGNTLLFISLGLNYFLWARYDRRFARALEELIAAHESTLD